MFIKVEEGRRKVQDAKMKLERKRDSAAAMHESVICPRNMLPRLSQCIICNPPLITPHLVVTLAIRHPAKHKSTSILMAERSSLFHNLPEDSSIPHIIPMAVLK